MDPEYTIRNATQEEIIQLANKWSSLQGWHPGITDGQLFFLADPKGFFVGEVKGQIVTTIIGTKGPRNFGFIGFYICKKEHRGKGYGLKIFNHCMDYLKGCNISLESVAAQVKNYSKIGFKAYSQTSCSWFTGLEPSQPDANISNLKDVDFESIYTYWINNSTGFNKEFCNTWINHKDHWSFGYFEEGKLVGFIGMRKTVLEAQYRMGPLIAQTPQIADKLVAHIRALVGLNSKIIVNMIERNEEAVKLGQKLKITVLYKCTRMYTQGEPDTLNNAKNYAITAPDLG